MFLEIELLACAMKIIAYDKSSQVASPTPGCGEACPCDLVISPEGLAAIRSTCSTIYPYVVTAVHWHRTGKDFVPGYRSGRI